MLRGTRRTVLMLAGCQALSMTGGSIVGLTPNTLYEVRLKAGEGEATLAARTRDDRRTKRPGKGTHVRPLTPRRFRSHQLHADVVFEHVRRSVGFDVQRAPERRANRGVVGSGSHAARSNSAQRGQQHVRVVRRAPIEIRVTPRELEVVISEQFRLDEIAERHR